ncbi:MAG: hypothetical protein ACKV2Q_24320 [Planctomycetaceae bacterium]
MTVQALMKEIRRLRADELRLVAAEVVRLDEESSQSHTPTTKICTEPTPANGLTVHWPDRTARRREIFGEAVLPNLVLEEREQSRASCGERRVLVGQQRLRPTLARPAHIAAALPPGARRGL